MENYACTSRHQTPQTAASHTAQIHQNDGEPMEQADAGRTGLAVDARRRACGG
jgi:hypothetical protein